MACRDGLHRKPVLGERRARQQQTADYRQSTLLSLRALARGPRQLSHPTYPPSPPPIAASRRVALCTTSRRLGSLLCAPKALYAANSSAAQRNASYRALRKTRWRGETEARACKRYGSRRPEDCGRRAAEAAVPTSQHSCDSSRMPWQRYWQKCAARQPAAVLAPRAARQWSPAAKREQTNEPRPSRARETCQRNTHR